MLRDETKVWQCGDHAISLARPRIMGILNVTPDSFSDGGEHVDADAAIAYGLQMLDDGADIIDVGGESTRPGFAPVSPEEEAERILPVVEALVEAGAIVSVDTRHAEVAAQALELGASIINDVTGFTDPAMLEVVKESNCGCVIMHSSEAAPAPARREVQLSSAPKDWHPGMPTATVIRVSREEQADAEAEAAEAAKAAPAPKAEPAKKSSPLPAGATGVSGSAAPRAAKPAAPEPAPKPSLERTMAASAVHGVRSRPAVAGRGNNRRFALPDTTLVMREIMGFLGDQARSMMRAGINQKRICVDPGAGFGKAADEDVVIQRATEKLASMGYPVLCAVSRKRFVGAISGVGSAAARDAATLGVVMAAIEGGARIFRVHDVAGTAQAINAYWACARKDERRAFVAMGSNVGDPIEYLDRARELIDSIPLTCVTATSHVYESEPALGLKKPVTNAMVEVKTELAPLVLLDELLAIEDEMGRVRETDEMGAKKATDRTIDLDLVWYDGETHAGPKLTLPHPGLGLRDFVIVPLDDLVHDGERFLRYNGIEVLPVDERLGRVTTDLGDIL